MEPYFETLETMTADKQGTEARPQKCFFLWKKSTGLWASYFKVKFETVCGIR